MSARPIRVASWPHWYAPNRYLDLFYRALEPFGIEHVPHVPLTWSEPLLREVDVVHLHWAYAFWRGRPRSAPGQLLAVTRLWRFLAVARRRAVPVIWTVHNVGHHEGRQSGDHVGERLLHRMVDLRIFHSQSGWSAACARYGPGRGAALVMPHGNYDGAMPAPAACALTLAREQLPTNRKRLLCFGQVRPYKGFDLALAALDHLPASEYHLIIAGRGQHGCAEQLRQSANGRQDVTLRLEEMSEQRLADLLAVSDAVLLPYRNITGSGVLMAALTAGRGVVATDLPYFREVLSDAHAAGVLAEPGNPRALAAAISAFFEVPAEKRHSAARALADHYSWPRLVRPVAQWLHERFVRSA
jgi:beta-1,4-mannosyltransferase